jgi:uncharacterized membrane protein YeaQ/YmgE (transglycosylase-associated protein family)
MRVRSQRNSSRSRIDSRFRPRRFIAVIAQRESRPFVFSIAHRGAGTAGIPRRLASGYAGDGGAMPLQTQTTLFLLIGGVVLLLYGRRLYWLFVGVIGFVIGMRLAGELALHQPPLVILAIALLAGLVGALLALWLQKAMVALAGFALGGAFAATLLGRPWPSEATWIAVLIGGVVGALLVLVVFDWSLIVLSSLAGGGLVVFCAAAALGILVQGWQLRGGGSSGAGPA